MGKINSISLTNFKFFKEEQTINLNGKHLLLYGENGSGKSSIYWALYTLFEASMKQDDDQIRKYFTKNIVPGHSLVNIHAQENPPGSDNYNSKINVVTDDDPEVVFEVSADNVNIRSDANAKLVNYASDFINYKMMLSLSFIKHSEEINLYDLFVDHILKYVKFNRTTYNRGTSSFDSTSAAEIWEQIKLGPDGSPVRGSKRLFKQSISYSNFCVLFNSFNSDFQSLINYVNLYAPGYLRKLGGNFDFSLSLKSAAHGFNKYKYNLAPFSIRLKINSYENVPNAVPKPQSFLNEAKLSALAISIRLTVLKHKLQESGLKFLVLDDLLVSLDMQNRDKVIDLLLTDEFINKYQLIILTHDKMFFEFVRMKISQASNPSLWELVEMYVGKTNPLSGNECPIIIHGGLSYLEKAKFHYKANDFSASALYIRKELEKLVMERLPPEELLTIDGKFKDLVHYWNRVIDRYSQMGRAIPDDVKNGFSASKMMVLNPQVHHTLSYPVYRTELEKAFNLIDLITSNCPVYKETILLSKGMQLTFTHPRENYTFQFEFLSDLIITQHNNNITANNPRCKVLSWQYNGNLFWAFDRQVSLDSNPNIEHTISQIIRTHTENIRVPLSITYDIFIANTKVTNGLWTLQEVLDKAQVILVPSNRQPTP